MELFPTVHVHAFSRNQGPYETAPEIGAAEGSRWCWTCISWVTTNADGFMHTSAERDVYAKDLALAIKRGQKLRRDAVNEYQKRFRVGFGNAVFAVDWSIGYYNEHGF
jgi:hypothetical protein